MHGKEIRNPYWLPSFRVINTGIAPMLGPVDVCNLDREKKGWKFALIQTQRNVSDHTLNFEEIRMYIHNNGRSRAFKHVTANCSNISFFDWKNRLGPKWGLIHVLTYNE